MANRSLKAEAKNGRGEHLTIHSQDTDSPILPVAQLERLHSFRPDLVDFVITQTSKEAEHRRVREKRVDVFIFVERILGQLSAIVLAVLGIGGGIYAGSQGMEKVAIAIITATIGTLAVALVTKSWLQKRK
jgi:uncharacterized membrane protein